MFSKFAVLLAFVSVLGLVAATPPACLLAAINKQQDPSNVQSICSANTAPRVEAYIQEICKAHTDAALKAFRSSCGAKGVTVAPANSTSSYFPSGTGRATLVTFSATATGGVASPSGYGPASPNATVPRISNTPSPTGTPFVGGASKAGSALGAVAVGVLFAGLADLL